MKKICVFLMTLMMLLVLIVSMAYQASALPWTEIGDAGDVPSTAQEVIGSGGLDIITGTIIGSGIDIDMYKIYINSTEDTLSFSASSSANHNYIDPQLFLFDADGIGVYATEGNLLPSSFSLTPRTPGIYYLAISSYNLDPFSPKDANYQEHRLFPEHGNVVGPIRLDPVASWGGTYSGIGGSYSITLTGAEFLQSTPVPEPATLILLGIGLLGLIGCGVFQENLWERINSSRVKCHISHGFRAGAR